MPVDPNSYLKLFRHYNERREEIRLGVGDKLFLKCLYAKDILELEKEEGPLEFYDSKFMNGRDAELIGIPLVSLIKMYEKDLLKND